MGLSFDEKNKLILALNKHFLKMIILEFARRYKRQLKPVYNQEREKMTFRTLDDSKLNNRNLVFLAAYEMGYQEAVKQMMKTLNIT